MSNVVEKSQLIVGVDAGHNEIKIFTVDPVTKNEVKFSIPSIGKQGEGDFLGEIDEIHKKLIVVNNEVYSVDPNIPSPADTRTDDYPISNLNLALIYKALQDAQLPSNNLLIGTGLPLDRYYGGTNRSQNIDLINRKLKNINEAKIYTKYDESHKKESLIIKSKHIFCEGQGTLINMLMDNDGEDTPYSPIIDDYSIGIIDIGGRTTDCLVTNPVNQGSITLNGSRSKTKNIGMLDVHEELRTQLKAYLNVSSINDNLLREALKTGMYGFLSNKKDVQTVVNSAKEKVYAQLKNFVSLTIGDGNDVALIVLSGGGSYLFEDFFKRDFPSNLEVADDRSFTNAKGFYKALAHIV